MKFFINLIAFSFLCVSQSANAEASIKCGQVSLTKGDVWIIRSVDEKAIPAPIDRLYIKDIDQKNKTMSTRIAKSFGMSMNLDDVSCEELKTAYVLIKKE